MSACLLCLSPHEQAANNKQRAFMSTLAYDFLEQKLTGKAGDA